MKRTPAPMATRRQRGATRLELVLGAILAAVLSGLLLNSIISYRGESEQVAAKQLIGSLRTALAVRSAKVISTRGEAGLLELSHQNPMTWLQQQPQNYLGEYYSPNKDVLPKGNWYFDRAKKTLVYLTAAEKSFSVGTQKMMTFKVKLIRVPGPADASGHYKGTTGLVIDQVSDRVNAQAVAFNSAESRPRP
jgi:type II secretory pathway pseudopilin PulG